MSIILLCNLTSTDEAVSTVGQSGSFYGKADGFVPPQDGKEQLTRIVPETNENVSRCILHALSL